MMKKPAKRDRQEELDYGVVLKDVAGIIFYLNFPSKLDSPFFARHLFKVVMYLFSASIFCKVFKHVFAIVLLSV